MGSTLAFSSIISRPSSVGAFIRTGHTHSGTPSPPSIVTEQILSRKVTHTVTFSPPRVTEQILSRRKAFLLLEENSNEDALIQTFSYIRVNLSGFPLRPLRPHCPPRSLTVVHAFQGIFRNFNTLKRGPID